MNIRQTWTVMTSNWIGAKTLGRKVLWIKKGHDKKIYDYAQFPQYVKDAFEMNDEHRTIESFTNDDAIKIYEEHGAVVKKVDTLFTKIIFEIVMYNFHRKNVSAFNRAAFAKRDRYGRFVKEINDN